MTPKNNIVIRLAAVLICVGFTGCQSQKNVSAMGNGYEETPHRSHAFMQKAQTWVSLDYRDSADKTTEVWPTISTDNVIIKGDLAVFVGDKAFVTPQRTTHPRLFAVKSPELPIDISDEVLHRWCVANSKLYSQAANNLIQLSIESKDDGLIVHLEFWTSGLLGENKDWPDASDLNLNWPQVKDIMNHVKARGIPKKDPRWDTPYIGEKF
jgi:hypothetical protein